MERVAHSHEYHRKPLRPARVPLLIASRAAALGGTGGCGRCAAARGY